MSGRDEMRALKRAESACVQAAQCVVAAGEGDVPAPVRVQLARTLQRLAEARAEASAAIIAFRSTEAAA